MRSGWGSRSTYATRNRGNSVAGAVVARERAIAWARAVVADPDIVFLDTETTGLDGAAEIVDIAVLAGDGSVLLDTLVRPTRPIPSVASGIHGIRDADVSTAPTWDQVYLELDRLVRRCRVIVYNARFDSRLVTQCCAQHAIDAPVLDWQCAMLAFAEFCAEPGREGGFKWHRLARAANRFGITAGGHRALADARVCRSVVMEMALAGGE